MMDEIVTRNM